jgi:ribokinase
MKINILAAKHAKQHGKLVMLDCGGSDEEIPKELIENLDFISPNSTELLRIDGTIDENNMLEEVR